MTRALTGEPDRRIVGIAGDAGFLMKVQQILVSVSVTLDTGIRLMAPPKFMRVGS
jgi:thiamine pyrophosphate-dependent acetolactate synthase large subunit-like protein